MTLVEKVIQTIQGVPQNNPHHQYDLLGHTQEVVAHLEKNDASQELILAGWLHDVGKAAVRRFDPEKGYDIFHGHADASVEWNEKNCPNVSSDVVAWVKYHDIAFQSPKTVARYVRKFGAEWVRGLLLLQEADKLAQSSFQREAKITAIEYAKSII